MALRLLVAIIASAALTSYAASTDGTALRCEGRTAVWLDGKLGSESPATLSIVIRADAQAAEVSGSSWGCFADGCQEVPVRLSVDWVRHSKDWPVTDGMHSRTSFDLNRLTGVLTTTASTFGGQDVKWRNHLTSGTFVCSKAERLF
ncbi:hypothetical protein MW290_25545 [Aquincola tertiaricarbonis]|uniref:Ig-like domain-containing protein n=1 Tax=Aquincola tertiaricarbonis TaxID=391953 RepID=A0ABY4SA69_AQUTE|nr:hypothetical protein [Aquincola tertiaricarbonis]URI08936.1 hypothetical protein MW290_25545 [Aquincola tertiaricarbonis]